MSLRYKKIERKNILAFYGIFVLCIWAAINIVFAFSIHVAKYIDTETWYSLGGLNETYRAIGFFLSIVTLIIGIISLWKKPLNQAFALIGLSISSVLFNGFFVLVVF